MINFLKFYFLPFLLFLAAIFILLYHFKHDRSRLILIVLFIIFCFIRISI